jgi:hypothetical protein
MKRVAIYIFLSLFFLLSCTKDRNGSFLVLDVDIEPSAGETKAIFTGTSFTSGSLLGLFVYYAEDGTSLSQFVPYSDKYVNIKASYASSSSNWKYTLPGSSSSFDDGLYLIKPDANTFTNGLSVCAYSPWIDGVTRIDEIPFAVGGNYNDVVDLMYAKQNAAPVKIVPDGNAKAVELTFRHAMSLLWIGFKCKHDQTTMSITSISLKKKKGGSTSLYASGVFDAVEGVFHFDSDKMVEDTVITTIYSAYQYNKFTNSDYVYLPFLIVPQEYSGDGDYILEFCFDNQNLRAKYPIKISDIKVDGESEASFKSGYSYRFKFTFNNFVQIDNVKVDVSSSWVEEPVKEFKF